jgi:hypothetical protein
MLEQEIITHLRANVTSLGTRIYRAGQLYSLTMPAAIIERTSSVPIYVHQGRCDTRRTEFAIIACAATIAAMDTLVGLIEAAMETFVESGGRGPDGRRARQTNMMDEGFSAEAKIFSARIEYEIIH